MTYPCGRKCSISEWRSRPEEITISPRTATPPQGARALTGRMLTGAKISTALSGEYFKSVVLQKGTAAGLTRTIFLECCGLTTIGLNSQTLSATSIPSKGGRQAMTLLVPKYLRITELLILAQRTTGYEVRSFQFLKIGTGSFLTRNGSVPSMWPASTGPEVAEKTTPC